MVSFKFYLGENVSMTTFPWARVWVTINCIIIFVENFPSICLIQDQTFYTNASLPFLLSLKNMINVFMDFLLTENQRTIEEIPREYSTHRLDSISYRRKPVRTVREGRTQILGSVISYMYVLYMDLCSYRMFNVTLQYLIVIRRHFVCLYQKYNMRRRQIDTTGILIC